MKKVVCINNGVTNDSSSAENRLTIGKIYDVDEYDNGYKYCRVLSDDTGLISRLYRERFITLKEYRKLKLKKINENR
jgi:hypothetical protein